MIPVELDLRIRPFRRIPLPRVTHGRVLALALGLFCLLSNALPLEAQEVRETLDKSLLFLGAGGRPIGLGERYAGVPGDAYSLIYNPGGLAFQNDAQATAGFAPIGRRGNRDFEYWLAGGSIGFGRGGTLGLTYEFLDEGGMIELADVQSEDALLIDDESMTRIGYGIQAKRWLGVGFELKSHTSDFIEPSLFGGDELSRTVLVDIGVIARRDLPIEGMGKSRLTGGFVVQNMGEDLEYGIPERKATVPTFIRAGAAYELVSGRRVHGRRLPLISGMAVFEWAGTTDSDYPFSHLGGGVELRLIEVFAFRTGISTRLRDRGVDNSDLNLGFGVAYPGHLLGRRGLPLGIGFDYAYRQEPGTSENHSVYTLNLHYRPPSLVE